MHLQVSALHQCIPTLYLVKKVGQTYDLTKRGRDDCLEAQEEWGGMDGEEGCGYLSIVCRGIEGIGSSQRRLPTNMSLEVGIPGVTRGMVKSPAPSTTTAAAAAAATTGTSQGGDDGVCETRECRLATHSRPQNVS